MTGWLVLNKTGLQKNNLPQSYSFILVSVGLRNFKDILPAWYNAELAKNGHNFRKKNVVKKMKLSNYVIIKSFSPKKTNYFV